MAEFIHNKFVLSFAIETSIQLLSIPNNPNLLSKTGKVPSLKSFENFSIDLDPSHKTMSIQRLIVHTKLAIAKTEGSVGCVLKKTPFASKSDS